MGIPVVCSRADSLKRVQRTLNDGAREDATYNVLYIPGLRPKKTTQRRDVDFPEPLVGLDGVGVGVVVLVSSIACSQALRVASDSGVSEKWENIEESESRDARRRSMSSSVSAGMEEGGRLLNGGGCEGQRQGRCRRERVD